MDGWGGTRTVGRAGGVGWVGKLGSVGRVGRLCWVTMVLGSAVGLLRALDRSMGHLVVDRHNVAGRRRGSVVSRLVLLSSSGIARSGAVAGGIVGVSLAVSSSLVVGASSLERSGRTVRTGSCRPPLGAESDPCGSLHVPHGSSG